MNLQTSTCAANVSIVAVPSMVVNTVQKRGLFFCVSIKFEAHIALTHCDCVCSGLCFHLDCIDIGWKVLVFYMDMIWYLGSSAFRNQK